MSSMSCRFRVDSGRSAPCFVTLARFEMQKTRVRASANVRARNWAIEGGKGRYHTRCKRDAVSERARLPRGVIKARLFFAPSRPVAAPPTLAAAAIKAKPTVRRCVPPHDRAQRFILFFANFSAH